MTSVAIKLVGMLLSVAMVAATAVCPCYAAGSTRNLCGIANAAAAPVSAEPKCKRCPTEQSKPAGQQSPCKSCSSTPNADRTVERTDGDLALKIELAPFVLPAIDLAVAQADDAAPYRLAHATGPPPRLGDLFHQSCLLLL